MRYAVRDGTDEAGRQALAFGAADTSKEYTLGAFNGVIHELDVEIPNWTNDVTLTAALIRANGITLSIGGLVKNAKHALVVSWAVRGGETIRATLSGAPGGTGGTVYFTPIIV